MKIRLLVLLVVPLLMLGLQTASKSPAALSDFTTLAPFDAHAHIFNSGAPVVDLLARLNVRLLNVCVVDKYERGYEDAEAQHAKALELFRATGGRLAWCSTFDPADWEKPDFAEKVIAQLDQTFKDGAVAVKIYKSIGMELKDRNGKYIMPDHPAFARILDFIASRDKTLMAHIAEPSAAWKPLDPASPHYSYYKANPDWHMYQHPERPSKETILAARDHMLELHPKLRVLGAHLGSMEDDVDQIASRFDRYPNFVVDTAARVPDLMIQPRDKVRAFLMKYQDRVLYGTDLVFMPWEDAEAAAKHWEEEYLRDWKYFSTEETVSYGDRRIQGLGLPKPVLAKVFRDNAKKWIPGATPRAGK